MTTQEIQNTVINHLLAQNCRSSTAGTCLYRGPNNTSCAVGCLIKDEFYCANFEKSSINGAQGKSIINAVEQSIGRGLTKEEFHLLFVLQKIHDIENVGIWPEIFKDFNYKNHLWCDKHSDNIGYISYSSYLKT